MDVKSEQSLLEVANQALKVYKRTSYGKVGLIALIFVTATLTNLVNTDFFKFGDEKHIAKILLEGEVGGHSDTGSGYAVAEHILEGINSADSLMIVIEADSNGGSPTDAQIIENVIVQYKHLATIKQADLDLLARYLSEKQLMYKKHSTKNFMTDAHNIQSEVEKMLLNMARKPIVAVISKVCASACLQSIIHADIVISQHASLVGNVGVRLDNINWSGLADKLGVSNTVITSGRYKDMLSPWKSSSEQGEERGIAKEMLVVPVFEQFKRSVESARGKKLQISKIDLFSGKVWTGVDARSIGLVDINADKLQVQKNLEALDGIKYLSYSKSQMSLSNFLNSALEWISYR